ncbi:terminase gpP N-terminus-related DNA-binding protein [Bacteroides uniformis]|uniref:terminase gpP N-terminus-related DNA-binding protein n=1 Tax=Bacteroides uniformis TaxID=820 RepID=UPI003569A211
MATKKELEDKREYARLLFMQGETQKVIAEKVGVSAVTINKWVAENGWQEQRAASSITRPELVNKLLHTIDRLIEQVNESEDPEAMAGLGDKLAKLSTTIERLDKKASIVDVIEVFMAFSKWMQFRMSFDDEITPELLKTINKYHDLYINELLQNKFNQ